MTRPVTSLYIHIPFCKDRCLYCDFYSERIREVLYYTDDYIDALKKEFIYYKRYISGNIRTLYIGGGTPSSLSLHLIHSLLGFISENLSFAEGYEFTFEMNPDSVSRENLALLREYGVNRISLGVQSLNDTTLKSLNRVHSRKSVFDALEKIFGSGFANVSTDFLIGLSKNPEDLLKDTGDILQYPVRHISAYILTLNRKSIRKLPQTITGLDEQIITTQYELLHNFLTDAGFVHYEISNFAKKGCESKHNINYWKNGEYIGLGSSAAGHYTDQRGERIRYKNISGIKEYITGINTGNHTFDEFEKTDRKTRINEFIMLGLRTLRGVPTSELRKITNTGELEKIIRRSEEFERDGYLKLRRGFISPTLKGFIFNNLVVRELML